MADLSSQTSHSTYLRLSPLELFVDAKQKAEVIWSLLEFPSPAGIDRTLSSREMRLSLVELP